MTIRVTIRRAGVTSTYGQPLVVGQIYSLEDEFALSLIQNGSATDTDGVLSLGQNDSFARGHLFNAPSTLPFMADHRSAPNAAPIAGPTSTQPSILAPYSVIEIPANSMTPGKSYIEIYARFLRTGSTATLVPTAYVNTSNNLAAGACSDSTLAASGTIGEFFYRLDIVSSTSYVSTWIVNRVGATAGSTLTISSGFDVTQKNYITFGVNSINAADSVSLVAYAYRVYA